MVGSFRFSTRDVPVRARDRAVRALRERGILPMEPLPGRGVHVEIVKWFLPGAGILAGTLGGLRQDGGASVAGTHADDLFFAISLTGRSAVTQRGRAITPDDGEGLLVDPTAGPFAIVRRAPGRFIGLRVPRQALAPLVRDLDDRALRPIPRGTESLELLTRYLGAVLAGQALTSPDTSRVVATHLHDLVALSVGARREASAAIQVGGVRAARLRAIQTDIVANLEDCALSVAAIAARHEVTPRYVHKLFEGEGVSYTQFVLRQRLDRAYRALRDARFASRNISSIAYDVGFGDLSYFNRAFRRRYGVTPTDVRDGGPGEPRPDSASQPGS